MAKTVKWSVTGKEIDSQEPDAGYSVYEGELPPRGVYHFKPQFMRATTFQSGNSGLLILWKLVPTTKSQKEFKDCPLWDRQVDLPQNAWSIRQFLDAIGAEGSDWNKTRVDGDNSDVVAFGRVKFADIEDVKILVQINGERGELEVARYLPLDDESDDEDDDDSEDEDEDDESDDEDDDDSEDEDEDDESDDEDDDDSEDEDEDDDDEEEEQPPAKSRRGAKKAPAKAAKKATPAKRSAPASKKAAPAKAAKKSGRKSRRDEDAPF